MQAIYESMWKGYLFYLWKHNKERFLVFRTGFDVSNIVISLNEYIVKIYKMAGINMKVEYLGIKCSVLW